MNNIIHIYDNIGAKFYIEDNNLVIGSSLSGFKTLDSSYVGSKIPYLLKSKNLWEVGFGIIKQTNNKIIVERLQTIKSSNNNNIVEFDNNAENNFYVFANEINFNTAFHNVCIISDDTDIPAIRSTNIINISEKKIQVKLPDAQANTNLVLDFKTTPGNNYCKLLIDDNDHTLLFSNTYTRLISDGNKWIELLRINDNSSISPLSSMDFSTMNAPVGASGSLQYNLDGDFASAPVYVGSGNKILFGSATESLAFSVLPTSGNFPTVFNNTNNGSDFIVKGSGDKNLFFAYDGRLGINIPSGSRPQTALHILNNSCQESLRLENRNQCYPANITLYHKPNNIIQPGSTIGTINLSAKNSSNNQVEYAQIVGKANSYTTNATKGELSVKLENNGSKIEPIRISTSGIFISSPLYVNSIKYSLTTTSGNILMSDGSGNIILTNINNSPIINLLDGGTVVFTGVCS